MSNITRSSTCNAWTTAASTPSSSQSTQDIHVKAVIALPPLELEDLYSLDDDVITTVPDLIGRVSNQFDEAFHPDELFDYDNIKFIPGVFRSTAVMPHLAYHFHRAGFR